MEDYLVLYGDKKPEDNICLLNMFKEAKKIPIGWTKKDIDEVKQVMEKGIEQGKKQIIFMGLEAGWNEAIEDIKSENPNILIKVICNTLDSLLYYEYERENFFCLLELNKQKKVDQIAFLRKGQFELYKSLGYNCCFLMENYKLEEAEKQDIKEDVADKEIKLGVFPLSYTWDKNIFNQICIAKMMDNAIIRYLSLDQRMEEFIETMDIKSEKILMDNLELKDLIQELKKNDVNMDCSFTEYFHPIFFISMELGIPCLVGNHMDFLELDENLASFLITKAEDNPIINASMIQKIVENKEEILGLYKSWKEKYNEEAQKSKQDFLEMGRK